MTKRGTGTLVVLGAELAALLLLAAPADARGHRGLFSAHHGHPINAWMGSRRIRLR